MGDGRGGGGMRGCSSSIQHLFRIIISLQAINSDICQYREYCSGVGVGAEWYIYVCCIQSIGKRSGGGGGGNWIK